MHRNNPHSDSYDFKVLIDAHPSLEKHLFTNQFGTLTIDFHDENAVIELNKALLKQYYKISFWQIPEGSLCPPIPSRAEYLHQIADLLWKTNNKRKPKGKNITGLDIGVGSSCIYPLIGNSQFKWNFIGTEINLISLKNARSIIGKNNLTEDVLLVESRVNSNFFEKILSNRDYIDFTMCNPPFHSSKEEAEKATLRKNKNLNKKTNTSVSNFGGTHSELWCDGGEKQFVLKMIKESKPFGQKCFWFTTLVSKEKNVRIFEKELAKLGVENMLLLPIEVGNKKSRAIAWTFLTPKMQKLWSDARWN